MQNRKLSQMLLKKSEQDLLVMKKLIPESDISDETIGFHAQQTAEKMLKAILSFHEIEFPFTHRLAELFDLISDNNIILPDKFEYLRFLTPFAVDYRYDFYIEKEEPFDFNEILSLLNELRKWISDTLNI